MADGLRVGLLSLEPWDEVWRRNQHFAARLVRSGVVGELIFVEPPRGGLAIRRCQFEALPGISVVRPPLIVPRRYGGHRVLALWLHRLLRDVDVLWINDPVAGIGALRNGQDSLYDVTDDWRQMPQASSDRERIVAAEDQLAERSRVVVCSEVLADRWVERYAVRPPVVQNGVDTQAIRTAVPTELPGRGPHAVYVGTIHPNRIDVELVAELARQWLGTMHLVGPIGLELAVIESLRRLGVDLPGPIPSSEVPSWLVSADVLICPHVVDEFTLSLDAIKSHEYLATDRTIVATASSGFQSITAPGLVVVAREAFVVAVVDAPYGHVERQASADWSGRASEFASQINASIVRRS